MQELIGLGDGMQDTSVAKTGNAHVSIAPDSAGTAAVKKLSGLVGYPSDTENGQRPNSRGEEASLHLLTQLLRVEVL